MRTEKPEPGVLKPTRNPMLFQELACEVSGLAPAPGFLNVRKITRFYENGNRCHLRKWRTRKGNGALANVAYKNVSALKHEPHGP